MSNGTPSWATGDYLTHRFNPELGIGRVTVVDARAITVTFSKTGASLRVASSTDALVRVDFGIGRPVRVLTTQERTTITGRADDGRLQLANGTTAPPHELSPVELEGALLERLCLGDIDHAEDFVVRLRALQLLRIREAGGLGSFLGGRVRLFPHQLYVAERAADSNPVRWLLADEVGLGKTIEACLILNKLVHTRTVDRCLVVVPEALTVQWLGELWRKYHQIFTLLDGARLADVEKDFGTGFNPFDVHRRVVVALETLVASPELTEQAVRAGIDLLVVDEAQRLRRPPGHPGEPAWRAIAPIAALGRHVLLLSATPLEDDAHGFFRLLQLLRPDEFPEDVSFDDRLATGAPLPPCTSATRRADIGGLPPRVGIPVDVGGAGGWELQRDVEHTLRAAPAPHAVAQRKKLDRIRRALASGAALRAVLGPEEIALRQRADAMDAQDPRVAWLVEQAPRWREAGQKTLVFVAHRESLEMLRTTLSHRAQLATGVFHEELSSARRDTEVARFREPDGPSLLVSTECGGEGRNFEFCERLILFDLPWTPSVVEQRIGRLDRIGRGIPVHVVYFRPGFGIGQEVVRLFESLGLFREPLAGIEPQLAPVEAALDALALDPHASIEDEGFATLVNLAQQARSRIREAAYQQLHRDPYRAELAGAILGRVPPELDALNEEVVIRTCERLGFRVERHRGHRTFSIEFGSGALVDSLPGVPAGASWFGTFDREEAVERETLEFFASGHPLVEGLFAHLDDSPTGRAVRLGLTLGASTGEGLIAVYKDAGGTSIVALDASGTERPEWAAALARGQFRARRLPDERRNTDRWRSLAHHLGTRLDPTRRPYALASVAVRPQA